MYAITISAVAILAAAFAPVPAPTPFGEGEPECYDGCSYSAAVVCQYPSPCTSPSYSYSIDYGSSHVGICDGPGEDCPKFPIPCSLDITVTVWVGAASNRLIEKYPSYNPSGCGLSHSWGPSEPAYPNDECSVSTLWGFLVWNPWYNCGSNPSGAEHQGRVVISCGSQSCGK